MQSTSPRHLPVYPWYSGGKAQSALCIPSGSRRWGTSFRSARSRPPAPGPRPSSVGAAVRLLAAAERWDDVREIACETALQTHPLVAPDVIEQWYRCLPDAERRSPEGVLLQALVARAHDLA